MHLDHFGDLSKVNKMLYEKGWLFEILISLYFLEDLRFFDTVDPGSFYFDNLWVRNRIRVVNREKKRLGRVWGGELGVSGFLMGCLRVYFPQSNSIWCESFNFTHVSVLDFVQKALEYGMFKMSEMESLVDAIHSAYQSLERLKLAWDLKFESQKMDYILFCQSEKGDSKHYTCLKHRTYDDEYFGHISSDIPYLSKLIYTQQTTIKTPRTSATRAFPSKKNALQYEAPEKTSLEDK